MLVCWMDGIRKKLYLKDDSLDGRYTDTDYIFEQVIIV